MSSESSENRPLYKRLRIGTYIIGTFACRRDTEDGDALRDYAVYLSYSRWVSVEMDILCDSRNEVTRAWKLIETFTPKPVPASAPMEIRAIHATTKE